MAELAARAGGALRVVRTSTFRFAIVYFGIYAFSILLVVGALYWGTVGALVGQTEDTIDTEIRALSDTYRRDGLVGLVRAVAERGARGGPVGAADPPRAVYLLVDPGGRRLAGNLENWPPVADPLGAWIQFPVSPVSGAADLDARRVRARTFALPGGFRLLVGRDTQEADDFAKLVRRSLAWALAPTLLLGLAGGILMSRRMLRRLDAINRTSARIIEGQLQERVPTRRPDAIPVDEFDRLAVNLNDMLDRIEQLMAGLKTVTDNVAHDLRSPLTRLKGRLEALLRAEDAEGRMTDARRAEVETAIAEADGLIGTFNALLSIAKAEARTGREGFGPVDIGALARDAAELYAPLVEEAGRAFHLRLPDEEIPPVRGDRHLLTQVLVNLLENAVKHGGGAVAVRVEDGPDRVVLVVSDEGPGIAEADRARVLDRYSRLEVSRSTPGNGLGLSLVAAVASLHGATLSLSDTAGARTGLTVSVALPREGAFPGRD